MDDDEGGLFLGELSAKTRDGLGGGSVGAGTDDAQVAEGDDFASGARAQDHRRWRRVADGEHQPTDDIFGKIFEQLWSGSHTGT